MCLKSIVAAGVRGVAYLEPWQIPEADAGLPGLRAEYWRVAALMPHGVSQVSSEISVLNIADKFSR
jgi:hypothetical protein